MSELTPEAKAARAKYNREYMKKYRKTHAEQLARYQAKWRKENPEKAAAIMERYWKNKASIEERRAAHG